jgi:creatinine amidohydrolase
MILLAEATWTEIHELFVRAPDTVALLPVGAVEAHGPHLPLATDVVIAEGLARRLSAALEREGGSVALAPAIAYSLTEYGEAFAGTAGVGAEAARLYLRDVILGLARAGFSRVVVLNAHLEPAHLALLRAAAEEARRTVEVVVPETTARAFRDAYQAAWGRRISHADAYETSLLLAEQPALVREVRAGLPPNPSDLVAAMKAGKRSFAEAGGPQAYFGDPAAASAAEGEWIYQRLVDVAREALVR